MSQDARTASDIEEPPKSLRGVIRHLGPGLIVASTLIGSGELIATTKTGAQAGISLLWLIIFGCLIKVFCQVELGRYVISQGESTLAALNHVPGPRARVSWILWLWLGVSLAGFTVQAGILGGVSQALAMTFPLTGDYLAVIESSEESTNTATYDNRIWAIIVAVSTALILYRGRYQLIQTLAIVLVCAFTVLTIGNVVALQTTEQWHISLSEFVRGMSFTLPESTGEKTVWITALGAFGIIGVGMGDLVIYPYWCLEKGYARFVGPCSDDESWVRRARGWIRVMYFDAFGSMVIYTLVTVAFFLMGVAVLHREGLDPDGMRMISTLAAAYVPVFGTLAKWLFLSGAIAVLYSTFLVAAASFARVYTDALKVFGVMAADNQRHHERAVSLFSVVLPMISLSVILTGANPVNLVLLGGVLAGAFLPAIGFSIIYLRFTKTDRRLRPKPLWDVLLILSCVATLTTGAFGIYSRFFS